MAHEETEVEAAYNKAKKATSEVQWRLAKEGMEYYATLEHPDYKAAAAIEDAALDAWLTISRLQETRMITEEAQIAYEAAMAATNAVVARLAQEGLDDSEMAVHEDYKAVGKLEDAAFENWFDSVKAAARHTLGESDDHSE